MFAARPPVSPSPTRTSIKEANDHLQLLHTKVAELENTVKEQAESLIKKDEFMQVKVKEISELKDIEIQELLKKLEVCEGKIKQLEQSCREKDKQIETLSQRCVHSEDVASYVPVIDKLLTAMKKLPSKSSRQGSFTSRPKVRTNRLLKSERKSGENGETMITSQQNISDGSVDGHLNNCNQAVADFKIARSFNINRNFSDDEGDSGEIL